MIPQDCFELVKEFMFGTYVETDTMKGWQDSNKKMHGVVTFTDEDGTKKCLYEHGEFQHDIEIRNNEGQLTYERVDFDDRTRVRHWLPDGLHYEGIEDFKDRTLTETLSYYPNTVVHESVKNLEDNTYITIKKWYQDGTQKSEKTPTKLVTWYPNGVKQEESCYNGDILTFRYWDSDGNEI